MTEDSRQSFVTSANCVQIFGFGCFWVPQTLLCTYVMAINQIHKEGLVLKLRQLNLGVCMWTRYASLHSWGASQFRERYTEHSSAHSKAGCAELSLWSLQSIGNLRVAYLNSCFNQKRSGLYSQWVERGICLILKQMGVCFRLHCLCCLTFSKKEIHNPDCRWLTLYTSNVSGSNPTPTFKSEIRTEFSFISVSTETLECRFLHVAV